MTDLEIFESAFDSHSCGSFTSCNCGTIYWDSSSNNGWDWEEGEQERLQADPKAVGLEYAVSRVVFEGREYVVDCKCWQARAERVIGFLLGHQGEIGEFFRLKKAELLKAAAAVPVIEKTK